jgi:hypothetical protein
MIVSDGYETGDAKLLGREMRRSPNAAAALSVNR